MDPKAALTWLDAPIIDADAADLVQNALVPEADRLAIPLPTRIEVTWSDVTKPVPFLTLFGATIPRYGRSFLWESPKPNLPIGLARLQFRYGNVEIPFRHASDILQETTASGIVRHRRNRGFETEEQHLLPLCGLYLASQTTHEREWGMEAHSYVPIQDSEWIDFIERRVPELRERGWEIVVDPSFPWRVAQPESWFIDADDSVGDGPQEDWFGVELGAVVDGERVNLLPVLLSLLDSDPQALSPERLAADPTSAGIPLRLPDGRLLMFPADRARTLHQVLFDLFEPGALHEDGKLHVPRLRAAELAGENDWRWLGGQELQELASKLRDFQGIQPVPLPAGLKASLREYQQEGLNWLQFLREHQLGGVLADDMGLGKTIQTLAHLVVEKESGRADRPSLVVAPTSLMTNWRQEAERFAPGLRVLVLHGLDRKDHFDAIRNHDLVLTTYPLLPRDGPTLLKQKFHCLILDEAQFIKNPSTAAAQSAASLQARHRLCLTGTPIENHLGELWSLFHFLMPGFLGDPLSFRRLFRTPIEKNADNSRRSILARRVKPFLLRRRKEDVAKELPAKTEIVQNVELTGVQRDLYESVRLAMHQRVREEVKKKGFSRAHIVILDALLKLRQICCHPALLDLPAAKAVHESAKLDLLFELLPPMLEEGRRVLLFSQFTSMLALIEQELQKRKLPYVLLTGSTTDRATPIQRFQSGEVPLFLISLKAGGTGLNLTTADTVIHYDPWWNPAVENQATDRAHRIGQEKQVFVYRLLTVGTVEEKIAALQARKRELVKGLLDEGAGAKLQLTHEDLESLFAPVE
jgi:superfamily II DNA or RNA helicase